MLEIASGTGQHAVSFAEAFPNLRIRPSDANDEYLADIRIRRERAGLPNLLDPLVLDVHDPWANVEADAIVCINMIHIAPWSATSSLMENAATALAEGAPLALYGPYLRDDRPTERSNLAFHEDLRRRNPEWGLRRLENVVDVARQVGFGWPSVLEMPANNLFVTFRRD